MNELQHAGIPLSCFTAAPRIYLFPPLRPPAILSIGRLMTEGHGAPAQFLAEHIRKALGGVVRRGRRGFQHSNGIFYSLKMTPLLLNG